MNTKQQEVVDRVKERWAKVGCIYEKIVEKDGVVFMVLRNGTALSVDETGKTDWRVEGWN